MTLISRSRGSSPSRARSWCSGMLSAPGTRLYVQFRRITHVEEERAVQRVPVVERHVAAQHVRRHHPREVDGILRAAEGWRVGQLGLFQVVDREAGLDRHREGIDALGNPVLAEHLRAEQAAVGLPEDDFRREVFGARIVPRMRIRVEVDLLVVRVAKLNRAASRWRPSRRSRPQRSGRSRCPGCRGSGSRGRQSLRPRCGLAG